MNSKHKIAIWVSTTLLIGLFVAAFYRTYSISFHEDGWVRVAQDDIRPVKAREWYYFPFSKNAEYYPKRNVIEQEIQGTRENETRPLIRAKVSVHYTYSPKDIILTRFYYSELMDVVMNDATYHAIKDSNDESDMSIILAHKLRENLKSMGVVIEHVIVSSVETIDPVVEMNKRRRASRKAAMEAASK